MIEIWKDIKEYEGLYQVSNLGRIKSLARINSNRNKKHIILKPRMGGSDLYDRCRLRKNGNSKNFLVHRLVAIHFIENPENKKYVNHKDEDKTNNFFENLEWVTFKENLNHGTRNRRISITATNGKQSIPVFQIDSITNNIVKEWVSMSEAGRNGYSQGLISKAVKSNSKHKGFYWRLKN